MGLLNQPESIIIRDATRTDQASIKQIVHEAGINPLNLDWPRFILAEEAGRIVGVGQVKPHRDGSRELASIAVIPERRRQGIASAIITTLLEREKGVVYLVCRDELESFYQHFGFERIDSGDLPSSMARIQRLGNLFSSITRRRVKILVMRRSYLKENIL